MKFDVLVDGLAKVAQDVYLGKGTRVRAFSNLYGCFIGDQCSIGTYVEIQKGVRIGDLCKVQSHSFLCTGVEIGNRVFIGHGVMFTNDRSPRATRDDGALEMEQDWLPRLEKTVIEDDVVIGSNASILCGITIGKGAVVGLGAVVVNDVPPGVTVVGNPARVISK